MFSKWKFAGLLGMAIVSLMVVGCAPGAGEASEVATSAATTVAEVTQAATQSDQGNAATTEATAGTGEATSEAVTCTKLNLNDVTADQLMATIPGFSQRMTREFAEYRPYVSIQQFRREIGKYVDEATVASYETYVYVPIDPNNSDAETLMQIPGIDAEALVAGRPYADVQTFLVAVAAQGADASCYVSAS